MAYYKRLKDLREDNDLEQKNMIDIIGKSIKQYGRYERGEVDITFGDAIKLANYYKVSLDYIAGRTNISKIADNKNISEEDAKILEVWHNLTDSQKEMFKIMYIGIETKEEEKQQKEEIA